MHEGRFPVESPRSVAVGLLSRSLVLPLAEIRPCSTLYPGPKPVSKGWAAEAAPWPAYVMWERRRRAFSCPSAGAEARHADTQAFIQYDISKRAILYRGAAKNPGYKSARAGK